MYYNEGYPSDILPLMPQGTNSTMFTSCCTVAICDDQCNCPNCGRKVIGSDAVTDHDRHRIRWINATKGWNGK